MSAPRLTPAMIAALRLIDGYGRIGAMACELAPTPRNALRRLAMIEKGSFDDGTTYILTPAGREALAAHEAQS